MERTLYVIEYDCEKFNVICYDGQNYRLAVYETLYEAKKEKHRIYQQCKQNSKVKFKDFKIVEYRIMEK